MVMLMKNIALWSIFLCGTLTDAHALTVALYNISDRGLSSRISFDAASSGVLHQNSGQYLKIENTGQTQSEVRIYADHLTWRDSAHPAQVSLGTYPLHSIGFSTLQPGMVEFNFGTESNWKMIGDVNNRDTNPTGMILQPNEVRYVYFGVKTPVAAPGVSYQTKILVEVIDGAISAAAQAQDVRPKQATVTPNGDGFNDSAVFGITGSFEIKVFNIKGKLVRTLQNINVWDGRDDNGDLAESGVYAYKVKAPGVNVSGMLAVAR